MNEHICPVCGYDNLEFPPRDFSICACCGTEFDYDDKILTHQQLRKEWISKGFPWFDKGEPQPENWEPIVQLERAGFGADIREITASRPPHEKQGEIVPIRLGLSSK